ncbi:MAG TPA: hypothetical protein DEF41_12910 [Desulfovibrio sp.]|nr:hypothetical protein [Desulfovibrio sp.]
MHVDSAGHDALMTSLTQRRMDARPLVYHSSHRR